MYSKIYLRLEPLGVELVAAAARRAGHTVRLIDLQCEPHQNFLRLKSSISLALRGPYCRKHSSVSVDTVFRLSPKKFCGTLSARWMACSRAKENRRSSGCSMHSAGTRRS